MFSSFPIGLVQRRTREEGCSLRWGGVGIIIGDGGVSRILGMKGEEGRTEGKLYLSQGPALPARVQSALGLGKSAAQVGIQATPNLQGVVGGL